MLVGKARGCFVPYPSELDERSTAGGSASTGDRETVCEVVAVCGRMKYGCPFPQMVHEKSFLVKVHQQVP